MAAIMEEGGVAGSAAVEAGLVEVEEADLEGVTLAGEVEGAILGVVGAVTAGLEGVGGVNHEVVEEIVIAKVLIGSIKHFDPNWVLYRIRHCKLVISLHNDNGSSVFQ